MELKILTWNIAWGYGNGSEGGPRYQAMPLSHFESSIESISEMIRNLKIDIALFQEVDFHSQRSHFYPELDTISRKTGLIYRSEEVSWDHPYIPYPGLNPMNHFGKMRSGGGIISRFPIRPVFSEHLPKPEENLALYNWFYLNRYFQIVDIKGIRFCNLHLEAFSKENRLLHLSLLQNRLMDYKIDIAGGDFNGSIELTRKTLETYDTFLSPEATYPTPEAKDAIDGFVIAKNRFLNIKTLTLNTGTVSDHFPVLLELNQSQ